MGNGLLSYAEKGMHREGKIDSGKGDAGLGTRALAYTFRVE
jgi:hypothetical protein